MTVEAFFLPLGAQRFAATAAARGPWSPDSLHAGPPAALLGRAVERRSGAREAFRVVRMTFEILRPVPLGEVEVAVQEVQIGRSVELVDAELRTAEGKVAMRAHALRIRVGDESELPELPAIESPVTVPGPEQSRPETFPLPWDEGYHTSMEMRFAHGSAVEPGPAAAWFRMRVPLVADEEPSGLSRVLIAADSGNGISGALDFRRHTYVNPDLTVHLRRPPVGEWVGLDARTSVDQAGIGLADAVLLDEKAVIGRSAQSLFITSR
ncbi:thioesterase family protein [Streptacidiphilus jiangxiensis]|uniref:Thioesterase-like superfamily protein n=1 Tax=Streptacidiphilus jiangxiensis TaxID=235985 RepID=A0A1H7TKL5_STRJI|nr:thioesterase family protein [Streptacidiphilus jiangxiensis]SEL85442.1 Thioesterase-like superfamily protein [Streptacidiphilus jiangxiensis]